MVSSPLQVIAGDTAIHEWPMEKPSPMPRKTHSTPWPSFRSSLETKRRRLALSRRVLVVFLLLHQSRKWKKITTVVTKTDHGWRTLVVRLDGVVQVVVGGVGRQQRRRIRRQEGAEAVQRVDADAGRQVRRVVRETGRRQQRRRREAPRRRRRTVGRRAGRRSAARARAAVALGEQVNCRHVHFFVVVFGGDTLQLVGAEKSITGAGVSASDSIVLFVAYGLVFFCRFRPARRRC